MLRKMLVVTCCIASNITLAGTPQTVADSACPKYSVDIAAFATCEGDRVVKPDAMIDYLPMPIALVDDAGNPLPPTLAAIPRDPLSLTDAGNYLTVSEAHAAKFWLGDTILFIDVRDEEAVHLGGTPTGIDMWQPVARPSANNRQKLAYGFTGAVKRALAARNREINNDGIVLLICKDGRNAAIAAELLTQAGVTRVFVVRGGTDGENSRHGRETGWVAAGLPMQLASR